MSDNIKSVKSGWVNMPLKEPYVLSFRSIKSIDSVWVFIEYDSGRLGIGEAVPLTGYGFETLSSIRTSIHRLSERVIGCSKEIAMHICREAGRKAPFASSSVASALDFPDWISDGFEIKPTSLVFPIASFSDKSILKKTFEDGFLRGFRHFKMKIGKDLKVDIESALFILEEYSSKDFTLRFDANQAFSYDEAVRFSDVLSSVDYQKSLWLEQPLCVDDWGNMERLCTVTDFPMMLDESIYSKEDIIRAKKIGCKAIKLKLAKYNGMDECIKLARYAKNIGLDVTLGNGVATDIGNLSEALIYSRDSGCFVNGLEFNGFAKLTKHLAFPYLKIKDAGEVSWDSDESNLDKILNSFIKENS
jgi:L-alanine-DL-glutamate epimerase-like enolase superfamily enzyme